jgi:hypothetical protein
MLNVFRNCKLKSFNSQKQKTLQLLVDRFSPAESYYCWEKQESVVYLDITSSIFSPTASLPPNTVPVFFASALAFTLT